MWSTENFIHHVERDSSLSWSPRRYTMLDRRDHDFDLDHQNALVNKTRFQHTKSWQR